jgi:hypothetical protein
MAAPCPVHPYPVLLIPASKYGPASACPSPGPLQRLSSCSCPAPNAHSTHAVALPGRKPGHGAQRPAHPASFPAASLQHSLFSIHVTLASHPVFQLLGTCTPWGCSFANLPSLAHSLSFHVCATTSRRLSCFPTQLPFSLPHLSVPVWEDVSSTRQRSAALCVVAPAALRMLPGTQWALCKRLWNGLVRAGRGGAVSPGHMRNARWRTWV